MSTLLRSFAGVDGVVCVIQDVPHFIKWFHSVRVQPAATEALQEETAAPAAAEVAHVAAVEEALGAAGGGIGPGANGAAHPST